MSAENQTLRDFGRVLSLVASKKPNVDVGRVIAFFRQEYGKTTREFPLRLGQEKNNYRMQLYKMGYNDVEIAAKVGVTASTIRRWRVARGLIANRRRGKPRGKILRGGGRE